MAPKLTDDQIAGLLKPKTDKVTGDVSAFDVSLDEIEHFGDDASFKEMRRDIGRYNRMLRERIIFINDSLSASVPFTRENLYLICAYTGNGKSTIAANISYPLWKQGKKVLVISNEESKQDVLFRISCLDSGHNFNDYKKGTMPIEEQKLVVQKFPDIAQCVKVLDVNYKGGLTTKLEGVKNALDAVKNADYSCVLIDYYQLIQYSVGDKTRSRYDVLNDLRIWMGQYIKNSNIPIVLFAQLHSLAKRQNTELDSRIKECPSILEPATVVIEVVPNFDDRTTEFILKKDRFGLQGQRIICPFDKGRYLEQPDDLVRVLAEQKLSKIQGSIGEQGDEELFLTYWKEMQTVNGKGDCNSSPQAISAKTGLSIDICRRLKDKFIKDGTLIFTEKRDSGYAPNELSAGFDGISKPHAELTSFYKVNE